MPDNFAKEIFVEYAKATIVTIISVAVGFIPLWIYLAVRGIANPEGFWQEFAVGVAALSVLGLFQLAFIVILIAGLLWFWIEMVGDSIRIIRRRRQDSQT